MTLKEKILNVLYGGALVTGTLSLQACVDATPEDEPRMDVNGETSVASNNTSENNAQANNTTNTTNTANTSNSTTDPNNKTNNTGVNNTNDGPCAEQARGLTQLPYPGWEDEVARGHNSATPYIVCADPEVVDCRFSQSAPSEVNAFLDAALGTAEQCELTSEYTGAFRDGVCGPFDQGDGMCCFTLEIAFYNGCAVNNIGRPFTVDGNARFANVARIDGWSEPCTLDALGDLPKELRAEIARAWADAGAHEHASIASFARFMMDLMSLGAPRELIEATTQAIADETRHATRCFSIASAFAGCSLGPEEVDVQGSMEHAGDEASILVAAIEEGCVGETLAAIQADWTVDKIHHDEIKQALLEIADDEGEHALLAWRFVDWMLETRPHLVPVARETFARMWMTHKDPYASGASERELAALSHGYLSPLIERRIRTHAFHHVVVPCAEALFANRGSEAQVPWPTRAVADTGC
jgi:hypothetical protein